jgi:hypothetical protein
MVEAWQCDACYVWLIGAAVRQIQTRPEPIAVVQELSKHHVLERLGQVEVWRLEDGRPVDEPRHQHWIVTSRKFFLIHRHVLHDGAANAVDHRIV